MKWPIRILIALVAIPVLLIAILAILLFTIDPNQFKPHIEQAAQKQKMDVDLAGDIGWQLWPNIGLQLQDLSFAQNEGPQKIDAKVQSMSFSVAVMPLLQREIEINGIALNNVDLTLRMSEDSAVKESESPSNEQSQPPGKAPTIAIKTISLNDIKITVIDEATKEQSQFTLNELTGSNVGIDGTPFPLSLKANVQLPELPLISTTLKSQLAFNLAAQTLQLREGEIETDIGGSKISAQLNTSADWSSDLKSSGNLKVLDFSPKRVLKALKVELPEMQNTNALSRAALSFNYALDHDQVDVKDIAIKLDDTNINGNLKIDSLERLALSSHWQGDSINLDDYLAPPSETPEETPSESSVAEAIVVPLEIIQQLDVDFSLLFEQIKIKGLNLDKPSLKIKAEDGVIELKEFNGNMADGEIKASSRFDVNGKTPQLKFNVDSKGVELGQILASMADVKALSGSAQLALRGSSHGKTDQALIKNLNVNMEVTSDRMQLIPINLEKQFCNALALLQQKAPPQFDWPDETTLKPASMSILLSNEVLNLKNLDATIAKLLGNAKGSFNLSNGDFNVPFSLSLGSFGGEIEGCLPIPEKWRKRALPIRCKGNIDDIGIKTCLPDTRLIEDMIKEKIKQKADEKIEEKKDEIEKKLKDKIKEELGEEKTEAAKEQLKGLLNQFKQK